ncbi:MAG: alcohol dehydrogenase catalytic domain-containing protein [Candidatus Caldarchaeum sp.]|nr:alcohol dehydrogenase catalytic domain-containing protein [Candidatus Caldarchaeum sp.]
MQAALLYGPSDLRVEDVAIPSISGEQVLVRVAAVGVCASDVKTFRGVYRSRVFEYGADSYGISGHEWSGEVVKVGEKVNHLSLGDRIVPEIIVPCNICKMCRMGFSNLCISKKPVLRGYAEYAMAMGRYCYKIPKNVSYKEAALTEPVAVSIRAVQKTSCKPGDTVLVVGAGPMGLIISMVAKAFGLKVLVSEVRAERLARARDVGVDRVINPLEEDLAAVVKSECEGLGADGVILATGAKQAIETAVTTARPGANIVLFASTYPKEDIVLDPNLIHYRELNVTGSYDHLPDDMVRALDFMSRKQIDVMKVVSRFYRLNELEEAFLYWEKSLGLKPMVLVGESP